MSELEIKLTEVMVKIMVRYPDGWERIEDVLGSVVQASQEMAESREIH